MAYRKAIQSLRRPVTLLVPILAVLLVITACTAEREVSLEETLLRLGDVPPGASVGDDGGCNQGFALEGASDEFRAWRLDPAGAETIYCFRQLERRGSDGGLETVESAVIEFADARTALASEAVAAEFLAYWAHQDVAAEPPVFQVGETQLAWRVLANHPERAGLAVSWTTGRFRHYVIVTGRAADEARQPAAELAATQQERFEHPTRLTDSDLDDSQAGLANAGEGPVYWVGADWAPNADPAAALARSDVDHGRGLGPGYAARLEYEVPESHARAFDIGTWLPDRWDSMLAGELGPVAQPTCAPLRETVLDDRRIEIHGMGSAPNCFSSASAYVFFDDAVVSIQFPHCFTCQPRESPYSDVEYLEALARALERR